MMNRYAKLDLMCTECKGLAEMVLPPKVKLCKDCYKKFNYKKDDWNEKEQAWLGL